MYNDFFCMLPNKFSSPWMGARNRYGISELQRKLQPQQHIETCLLEHGFLMKLQGFNTNLKFTTDDADESDDMLKKVSWYGTVKCRLKGTCACSKIIALSRTCPCATRGPFGSSDWADNSFVVLLAVLRLWV